MILLSTDQSTWGEKRAFDTIDRAIVNSASASANALRHRLDALTGRIQNNPETNNTLVTTTLLAAAILAVLFSATMSWRNFWRRNNTASAPPHVSDQDYSYITPNDIGPSSSADYGDHRTPAAARRPGSREDAGARAATDGANDYSNDSDPDILLLKHHKYKYTLAFPAYAIDDGALRVGDLRRRAADVTRTPDPERVKLLYKGKLLDEDSVSCKAEGMKQESEVLCVVSEVHPGEVSDVEMEDGSNAGQSSVAGVGAEEGIGSGGSRTGSKKKNRKKNNKNKKDKTQQGGPPPPPTTSSQAQQPTPAQPIPQQQQKQPSKGISTSASSLPAPAPNLKNFTSAHDQVHALSSYLHSELHPLCDEYAANTPTEAKLRDFEHKKLSETILAQVLLKADGIDPEGNPDTRNGRKQLVRDAQGLLTSLDQAKGSDGGD